MSYLEYVLGAYAVFAAFLAWDFAMPRLRLRRARANVVQRARRDVARKAGSAA